MKTDNEILRVLIDALSFYADKNTYKRQSFSSSDVVNDVMLAMPIEADMGKIANDALMNVGLK